jgi:hypothetical protein
LSFLLLVLDLLILGVNHFIRHSSGRIEGVFACKRIHDATVWKSENACVDELIDRVVTWYRQGPTRLLLRALRLPNSPQTSQAGF